MPFPRGLRLREALARHHGGPCRIEVGEEELELAFAHRRAIVENLRTIGYLLGVAGPAGAAFRQQRPLRSVSRRQTFWRTGEAKKGIV